MERARHPSSSSVGEGAAGNASADPRALAVEVARLIGEHITPPLLDAEEAGRLLNVPATWMLAQARARRVPHVRLGHYVRFDHDELLAWVHHRQAGPRSRPPRAA